MPATVTQCVELRADRARYIKEAGDILAGAKTAKRNMTAEEAEKFDKLHKGADELKAQIDREERQIAATAEVNKAQSTVVAGKEERGGGGEDKADVEVRNKAINRWMRVGISDLPADEREVMQRMFVNDPELRAQSTTTTGGGYTVAPDTSMYAAIDEALKQFTWWEQAGVTFIDSTTGANLPIPTSNDTAQQGERIAENTQHNQQDIAFGQVGLDSYTYSSKIVLVSMQLLNDSSINVEGFVGRKLGERIGRIQAVETTTGTGTSQPNGVVTASAAGVTAASATAIAYNDVLGLIHTVDPAYRPQSKLMFHDNILLALKKLVDSQARPLFLPGFAFKEPDTINGQKFVINQNMASAITTGQKTMLFGDFSKVLVRRVGGIAMLRLVERYAEFLQVGFLAFHRLDSDLLDAGTNPIKRLTQA